jgi:hypothetical protein
MEKPSAAYLKSLEERLAEPASRRQPANVKEVETFLRKYPQPGQVPGLRVILINEITATAGRGHDEELVQRAGAKYDKQTWRIALDYCTEGINRIEQKKCTEEFMNNPFEKAKMLGSLYSSAGNCALNIAKQMPNTEGDAIQKQKQTLLRQAIEFYGESIKFAEQTNRKGIAAYTYGFRADAYRELSEVTFATEKIENLVKAADDLVESARGLQAYDVENASRQYSFASSYQYRAAKLAEKTPGRQIELLKSAMLNAQQAQKYQNNADPDYKAQLDYDMGKYADALFEITKQPEVAKLAILYFRKAAEHFMSHPGPKDDLQQNALSRIKELAKFAV